MHKTTGRVTRPLARRGAALPSLAVGMAAGAILAVLARLGSVLPPGLRSVLTVDPLPDPGLAGIAWTDGVQMPAALQAADLDRLITLLGAGVALTLTVAVINLLVSAAGSAMARRHEMAVRHALGPSRTRMLGPLLLEGAMLVVLGAALAAALVAVALPFLLAAAPLEPLALRPEAALALTGVGAPVLLTLLLSTLPALDVWTLPSWSRLVTGEQATAGVGMTTARDLMLGGQIALAVALLFGAGLLLRSGDGARAEVPDVVVVPAELGVAADVDSVLAAARSVPGVTRAGLASLGTARGVGPLDAVDTECLCMHGTLFTPTWAEWPAHHAVTGGWFDTLGIAVAWASGGAQDGARSGPSATGDAGGGGPAEDIAGDRAEEPAPAGFATPSEDGPPVLVNRAFTDRGSLGTAPLERSIQLHGFGSPWHPVAGIVDDRHYTGPGAGPGPRPALYLPAEAFPPRHAVVALRAAPGTTLEPAAVRDALTAGLHGVSLGQATTLAAMIRDFAAPVRWLAGLLMLAGALAAFLAAYGTVAMARHLVRQRRREMGIRLAVGATPLRVAGTVLAHMATRVLVGGLAGLVATASVAHGLDVADPAPLLAIAATLVLLAAVGAVPTLLGALRMDPARLLREL